MHEDPAGVGEENGLAAGAQGRNQGEEDGDGQHEDAEGDCAVAGVDGEEEQDQQERQQRLGLVGVYGQRVVRGVEHLGERDEVE